MKALLLTTAIVLFTVVARSQDHTPATSDIDPQFTLLARQWMQAYNAGDEGDLSRLYAPEADYVSSHVRGLVAHGRDAIIANFHDGMSGGGHVDAIDILSVQSSATLTTLFCRYEATNSGEKAIGRNLLVLRKTGGKWLIVLHMTVV